MGFKITNENYQEYKDISRILMKHIFKDLADTMPNEHSPDMFLENLEKKSMSLARCSLQMGLNDDLSQHKYFPKQLINAINNDLLKNNLPDFSQLIALYDNTILKVLKRQKIRSLVEYYVVKEIVVDVDSDIDEENRILLDKYLYEFEFKNKKVEPEKN